MYVHPGDEGLIESYRRYLIEDGPMPEFPSDDAGRHQAFCTILRYVAAYYLRWDPVTLYKRLDYKLAQMFKLNALIRAYDLRAEGRAGYIGFILEAYPNEKFPRTIQRAVYPEILDEPFGQEAEPPSSLDLLDQLNSR